MKRAMWHLDKLLHQQMCCFFPNVTVSSKEGAGPAPPVRLESRGSLNVQANPSGCKIICFVGVAGDCPQVCVNHSAAAERRVATRVARGDEPCGSWSCSSSGLPTRPGGEGAHTTRCSLCKPTRGACRCRNGAAAATKAQQDLGTSTARDTSHPHNTMLRG